MFSITRYIYFPRIHDVTRANPTYCQTSIGIIRAGVHVRTTTRSTDLSCRDAAIRSMSSEYPCASDLNGCCGRSYDHDPPRGIRIVAGGSPAISYDKPDSDLAILKTIGMS